MYAPLLLLTAFTTLALANCVLTTDPSYVHAYCDEPNRYLFVDGARHTMQAENGGYAAVVPNPRDAQSASITNHWFQEVATQKQFAQQQTPSIYPPVLPARPAVQAPTAMPSVFGARQADQQKQYVIHDQNRRTVGQDTVYVQPIVPSAPPAEAISTMPEPRARRVVNEQRVVLPDHNKPAHVKQHADSQTADPNSASMLGTSYAVVSLVFAYILF